MRFTAAWACKGLGLPGTLVDFRTPELDSLRVNALQIACYKVRGGGCGGDGPAGNCTDSRGSLLPCP